MPDDEIVSLSEFARRVGASQQAISKAIKTGRLREALGRDERGRPVLNADVAAREWTAGAGQLRRRTVARADRPPVVATPLEFLTVTAVGDRLLALAVCDNDEDDSSRAHIVNQIVMDLETAVAVGRWLAGAARAKRDGRD